MLKAQKIFNVFFDDFRKNVKNEFGMRFIHIGLENSAVAAARVGGPPSRCSLKGVRSVDVYKTNARIILFASAKARAANWPSPAL